MDQFEMWGPRRLRGSIEVSGSKNAALPILFATLLTDEPCVLERVPRLADIDTSIKLLSTMGKNVKWAGKKLVITKGKKLTGIAPYDLVRRMRASVLVMGPLLARTGRAHVSLPGGCAIGARPVNFHLDGFKQMGVSFQINKGYIDANVKVLTGGIVAFPYASVGATENVMMGAVLAQGTTVIKNAAREPEIVDLGMMLKAMGASIRGLGTSTITIQGVPTLGGVSHKVIPDRIETGTFIIAAAITKGDITLRGADLSHLTNVVECLKRAGLSVKQLGNNVRARWVKPLKPVSIKTDVYPGFPTDMQAQWIALMSVIKGNTKISETVFSCTGRSGGNPSCGRRIISAILCRPARTFS
jgi:UDP-N-acetylglucosamine 1-carboxyvinyltransferase